MAATTEASTVFDPSQGRILLHGVDWGDYQKMLQIAEALGGGIGDIDPGTDSHSQTC